LWGTWRTLRWRHTIKPKLYFDFIVDMIDRSATRKYATCWHIIINLMSIRLFKLQCCKQATCKLYVCKHNYLCLWGTESSYEHILCGVLVMGGILCQQIFKEKVCQIKESITVWLTIVIGFMKINAMKYIHDHLMTCV